MYELLYMSFKCHGDAFEHCELIDWGLLSSFGGSLLGRKVLYCVFCLVFNMVDRKSVV